MHLGLPVYAVAETVASSGYWRELDSFKLCYQQLKGRFDAFCLSGNITAADSLVESPPPQATGANMVSL